MIKKENEKILFEIWEKQIKDSPDTIRCWALHHKSFIKWSINKIKRFCGKPYELVKLNEEGNCQPYNLIYILKKETPKEKPTDPPLEEMKIEVKEEVKEVGKRGRKKNE